SKLLKRVYLGVLMRVNGDGDQTVIAERLTLFSLFRLDHSQQPAGYQAPAVGRLVHEKQEVARVAALAGGRRDETEVEREDGTGGQDTVQLEKLALRIVLELVAATLGRLDDDVESTQLGIKCLQAVISRHGGTLR